MADVELRDIRKVYAGGVEAVKGVSLTVADGSLCVLVGPSGCGKSTLLRTIAGLETPSAGEVFIGGKPVNRLEPAERDIAMVFQHYALYPHMTVYDNMAYGLRNRGTPQGEIDRKVREAARILEIEAVLARKPRQLSGGQRQRVAMGRAIVRDPKVFLFDEPLSNLDAKLRGQMRVEIRKLQRNLGVTSVYVTHDQLEAMTLADRLVVMNEGRIEQAGRPLEIYERPASAFVASFIGAPAMNLLPVRAAAEGLALVDGTRIGGPRLPEGRSVAQLGIRPEHLTPAGPDSEPGSVLLPLTVEVIEAIGPESYVYGRAGGSVVVVRIAGKPAIEAPGRLLVTAAARHLHLFGEDGKRLG
jgi:sn-glycerol 3-phosphate transport system ATP-binding protein